MNADVVVAADGSGNYSTISEAINVVPPYSTRRFVIYVKQGLYLENVRIDMTKSNIMMYGDGMDQTIVSGCLSNLHYLQPFLQLPVDGSGFVARDMGFQNTAGPDKMQAVTLESSSDQSVFYKCSFDGYQDTLYTHSNRQFYRECRISGTIDFIFGQSVVVFQNCSILVKKPLHGQENVITASGKDKPGVNQGISIQNCHVSAAEDLCGARTFLGRPWKNYSTTIFMESSLDSLIDPEGWLSWIPEVPPPDTIYYAEYNNSGPGAVTSDIVKWKGVKVNITSDEANNFTVRSFINGVDWIPETSVPFQPDLCFVE
ncbi:UNVERIFIED_CONTAM: putative pectinesterase/pectinesterase inhibitor 46 [Sesamum latifolium]|uniref:Pectinesterase n=1 Tax=Sesamum latifolium TaxID=2727402 RepID=A0AAW2VG11_9LAMI